MYNYSYKQNYILQLSHSQLFSLQTFHKHSEFCVLSVLCNKLCKNVKNICFLPGSNRRPCACEAHVITTTLRKLHKILVKICCCQLRNGNLNIDGQKIFSSHLGIEPRTFGLEVQRAILCANGTPHRRLLVKPGMKEHMYIVAP